jgi:hypothetical protein
MTNISAWNYDESVKSMKVMVMKWSTLTVEMVARLYKAREELSNPGERSDLVQNGTRLNWSGYCDEIGLSRRTVEACYNIIKVCKGIANSLQVKP